MNECFELYIECFIHHQYKEITVAIAGVTEM